MTQRCLIEKAFPLGKVAEDSRHEKNVRHGHVSTLHIWPALNGIKMVLPPSVHNDSCPAASRGNEVWPRD